MMPTSKYFTPKELIQPSLFEHLTVEALMKSIGQFSLSCLDILREDYEGAVRASGRYRKHSDVTIHINGMYYGEEYKYSGLRSIDAPYAKNSTHKNANTFDLKCKNMDILLSLVLNNCQAYSIARIEEPSVTVPRGYIHILFDAFAKELEIFKPK
jgi:hypothetical protein